jgi:hypothetical protein
MHTSVRPTLTRPMYISRLAFSFCRMVRHLLARTRATLRSRKMCILRLTNLPMFMDLPPHNGALLNLHNHLQVLLRQPWHRQDGIDH